MDYTERYSDFEKEVDRYGLEAVAVRDNPVESAFAMRKLCEYFRNGVYYWLIAKQNSDDFSKIPDEKTVSVAEEKKHDITADIYMWLMALDTNGEQNYKRILYNKVNGFSYGVTAHDNPFFANIYKDIFDYPRAHAKAKNDFEEKSVGIKAHFSGEQIKLIKRIKSLAEANDTVVTQKILSQAAEENHKSLDKITTLWNNYNQQFPSSLTVDENEEIDIPDRNFSFECEEETVLGADCLLEKLNKIYREHFLDKHKKAFPPDFTNNLIKEKVKEYQKPNQKYDDTVRINWEVINEPDLRREYDNGRYLCICGWIFDWFERTRSEIHAKDIAKEIGMTQSNYSKTLSTAKDVIKKYI